jgi:hypothetical protein
MERRRGAPAGGDNLSLYSLYVRQHVSEVHR